MTNRKGGLSQAQQRRNHRHVMWVCRERVMRWAVGLGYNGPDAPRIHANDARKGDNGA